MASFRLRRKLFFNFGNMANNVKKSVQGAAKAMTPSMGTVAKVGAAGLVGAGIYGAAKVAKTGADIVTGEQGQNK